MDVLILLIPAALLLGLLGLGAYMWALKSGQFEDLDGASMRILIDDDEAVVAKDDRPEDSENKKDAKGND